MAVQVLVSLTVFTLFIVGVEGWRCAKYANYFSQQPDYIDCLWDCCGNSFNRHCCAPIGIIVGCCIVGAVVVAALTVLLICWWQRRRAKQAQGPRLFHNKRHSHYPVAPSSVTRPAPVMAFTGPEPDQVYKLGPPGTEYGRGPGYKPGAPENEYSQGPGYRPGPPQGQRSSPRLEKPPIDEYYDRPPQGYRPGPPQGYRPGPPQGYRPGPPQGYRPGPPSLDRSEKLSLDSHSGERAIDI